MKKRSIIFIASCALIAILAILIGGKTAKRGRGLFERTPLSVENTANVISNIRKIGELTTGYYYEEMVLKDTKADTASILGVKIHDKDEIVLIAKGIVRAGFDLSKLSEEDISAKADTLIISLPEAEIFDVILNPSDFETYYEEGKWSQEALRPVKAAAKEKLKENAVNAGILTKARESAYDGIKSLFKSFGFREVDIRIEGE